MTLLDVRDTDAELIDAAIRKTEWELRGWFAWKEGVRVRDALMSPRPVPPPRKVAQKRRSAAPGGSFDDYEYEGSDLF